MTVRRLGIPAVLAVLCLLLGAWMQEELASTTLRHLHAWQMPERQDQPDCVAEHPLRLLHPRTGKPILFVTERHADRILELDENRSRTVIARLLAHLYAPERRYEHWWQLHDLVMYDNLALQHARTEKSDPRHGPRTLQRVTLSDYTLAELQERMRPAGAAA